MTSRTSAVLFDLDGTLLDSEGIAADAFAEAYEQVGGTGAAPTAEFLGLSGHPFPEICRRLGLPTGMHPLFVQAARRRSSGLRLFPWVESLVQSLADRDVPLGIVTGKDLARTREALQITGLSQYMDTVVAADEGLPGKPSAAPVLEAARRLGVSHAVFVGDSVADVRAGRSAGAMVIACTWGTAPADLLAAAGPDHLLDDPGDLLPLLLAHQAATAAGASDPLHHPTRQDDPCLIPRH